MSAWTYLVIGILFEVVATSALKLSNGFTQPVPTMICVIGFIVALAALSQSVKTLEISVVYAIWSGAGITLISLIGLLFFNESINPVKLICIAMIVVGVVGLQLIGDQARLKEDGIARKRVDSEKSANEDSK